MEEIKMKITKAQKGITLVALITTITLLMILASVVLSTTEKVGVIDKTNNIINNYENKEKEYNTKNEILKNQLENKIEDEPEPNPNPELAKMVITLDKTTIKKQILRGGEPRTETITATVKNQVEDFKLADLIWTVETPNNEIDIKSKDSNSVKIVMEKAVENAKIKVSYKDINATCNITVTETDSKVGMYVNYGVSYGDMCRNVAGYKKEFEESDGWRYLGQDDDGNHLIISTGVPLKMIYNSKGEENEYSEKWWDADTSLEPNKRIVQGLLNNFAKIPYEEVDKTQAPTYENTCSGRFKVDNVSDVGDCFIVKGETYSESIRVRILTKEDIQRVPDENLETGGLAEGLFRLSGAYGAGIIILGNVRTYG